MHKSFDLNNQSFTLRLAIDSDYEFIFSLLKENMLESFIRNWGFWNEESFKENFRLERFRIIEHNSLPVGYIEFRFKPDCGYVDNINLVKDFQNQGLGTYLMKMLESETLNHSLTKIKLKTFKDSSVVRLYNRLGYVKISEDETSMIMEKIL